jgi:uncharacterized RDD family membrane protein YckC
LSQTNLLQIRTPEGVVFTQQLAGPIPRFLAWLLDALLQWTMTIAVTIPLSLFGLISVDLAQAVAVLTVFLVGIGYSIFFEWRWRGQSPGKRVARLRVVDAQGLRLKFSQIVIRNLLRVADALPLFYLTGGAACGLSPRSQRLGDFAANTIVVRVPEVRQPNLDQLMAGKFNSLRAYPHLEARLRQRVSAAEAGVALQAIARRDLLDPAARVELFTELAAHFRAKVSFPAEATDGITDEQFIRNVVDSLYRASRAPVKPAAATSKLTAAKA